MRLFSLAPLVVLACDAGYPRDARYPLNTLRWRGSHNSYHVAMPETAPALNYTHPPLVHQLTYQGVRQFELDLYYEDGALRVMHIPFFDQTSTCATLTDCVGTFAAWSKEHPRHAPVVIMIELKDDGALVPHEPFFDLLDATVTEQLALVTPAEVQRGAASMHEALLAFGWPTLAEARGKFLVFLLTDAQLGESYLSRERPLFVAGDADDPRAAFASIDDPSEADRIAAAVAKNMIVRTRADDPAAPEDREARGAAALASEAHIVSTDYFVPKDGYRLPWPADTVVACHPTLAPAGCTPRDLE